MHFIDVSNNQGDINWSAVFSGPNQPDGALLKITQGTSFFDPDFTKDYQAVVAAKKIVGLYHFADIGDWRAEYANFKSHVPHDAPAGTLAALDIETTGPSAPADFAAAWCDAFAADNHVRPFIYSDLSYAQAHLNDARLAVNPLWLALPGGRLPSSVGYWKTVTLWQNSWTATIPGINGPVDDDTIAETAAQLCALGKPAAAPQPKPAKTRSGRVKEAAALKDIGNHTSKALVQIPAGGKIAVTATKARDSDGKWWTRCGYGDGKKEQFWWGWLLSSNVTTS